MSDGSTLGQPAVSWRSDNQEFATVSDGIATGIALGSANIIATDVNDQNISDAAELKVDTTVTGLVILPEKVSYIVGQTFAFSAMATLSDGSVLNVTHDPQLNWQSDNGTVSKVVDGKATGIAAGTSKITLSGRLNEQGFLAEAEFNVVDGGGVVTWDNLDDGGNSSPVQDQLNNVTSISRTLYAFAAIKKDGTVVTWGESAGGGNSSSAQKQLTNIVSISGTDNAFAAIKSDGTVVTWGDIDNGGDSSHVQAELVDITSISGTTKAFAAIKSDGTVVTWGNIYYGEDSSSVQDQLNNVTSITGTNKAFAVITPTPIVTP